MTRTQPESPAAQCQHHFSGGPGRSLPYRKLAEQRLAREEQKETAILSGHRHGRATQRLPYGRMMALRQVPRPGSPPGR
eukprot:26150-Hanusia_phi.AAC.1